MPEQAPGIPVLTIEPYPGLQIRPKKHYEELDDLVESIRQPKVGQLQPGRVVPRGAEGYYVYIGVRRFLAVKKLYQEAKSKEEKSRFQFYYASVDQGLTGEEMLLRALEENRGGGVRRDIATIEELKALRNFKITIDAVSKMKAATYYVKLISLPISDIRLGYLQTIEAEEEDFTFKITHLESLGRIGDDADFIKAAVVVAHHKWPAKQADQAVKLKDEAFSYPYFAKTFPQLDPHLDKQADELMTSEPVKLAAKEPGAPGQPAPSPDTTTSEEAPTKREPAVPQEDGVITISCPHCGNECAVRPKKEDVVYTFIDLKGGPSGTPLDAAPEEATGKVTRDCEWCGKTYYCIIRRKGVGFFAEADTEVVLPPEKPVELVAIRYSYEDNSWIKIDAQQKEIGRIPIIHR